MKRTLYAHVVRDAAGKKKPNMGEVWGELKRSEANTKCIQTGSGLMVLDIDTKNLKKIDKKLIKLLPKQPTVETANGYHWYFEGDVQDVNQTQALFKGVDIRNEGGLVFAKYWGDDPSISYVKVGERYKLNGNLKKYLIKASKNRNTVKNNSAADVVASGAPWTKIPDGEQHDGLRRRVEAGFKSGLGYAGVKAKYDEYIDNYLTHDAHEHKLRDGLLDHGQKHFGSSLEGVSLDPGDLEPSHSPTSSLDDIFKGKWMDDNKLNQLKGQRYLGLFGRGMNTILWGASGTYKTSIAVHECINILKEHREITVWFWSFDASTPHNKAIYELTQSKTKDGRFRLLYSNTKNDFYTMYEEVIANNLDLHNEMIIIDTYKYISDDVNQKKANVDALHFIKKLTGLGATVLTLSHANKNGEKQSGTAEIEQDSDAVLRIDNEGNITTISPGGRIRYHFEPISFRIPQPDKEDHNAYRTIMEGIERMVKSVDVVKERALALAQENDKHYLDEIKNAFKDSNMVSKQDLLKNLEMNGKTLMRYLKKHEGVLFNLTHDKKYKNALMVELIKAL